MGNSAYSLGDALQKRSSSGNVGGMFSQLGIKPTGDYASGSGYQNMMQRLYGNPSLTGQYQTTKSAAQPNAFGGFRAMNMMPYWMALTRRFMNGR